MCVPHDTVCLRHCGGLKAQLLPIAQGSALGKRYALIKVSRSVRAAFIMRGNAPWHCLRELRARGAWHFCASAKMPNVLIAEYDHPGRCPGLWATIGLSARPIFFQPTTKYLSDRPNCSFETSIAPLSPVTANAITGDFFRFPLQFFPVCYDIFHFLGDIFCYKLANMCYKLCNVYYKLCNIYSKLLNKKYLRR